VGAFYLNLGTMKKTATFLYLGNDIKLLEELLKVMQSSKLKEQAKTVTSQIS